MAFFPVVAVAKADKRLMQRISELSKNIRNEQNIVASRTAKRAERIAAKLIQSDLGRAITQKEIRNSITRKQLGKGTYVVRFKATDRIQLSKFRANQTRVGLSYKMQGERKVVPHAFMGNYPLTRKPPKLKGGAWKRMPNAPRAKIVQLFGPSAFGVINPRMGSKELWTQLKSQVGDEFRKQMLRRIDTLIYRSTQG